MSTTVYNVSGWSRSSVGEISGSDIYSTEGWGKTQVGEVRDGRVFKGGGWSKEEVGYFENGRVYRGSGWSAEQVGEYENGTIYAGSGWGAALLENTAGPMAEPRQHICFSCANRESRWRFLSTGFHFQKIANKCVWCYNPHTGINISGRIA